MTSHSPYLPIGGGTTFYDAMPCDSSPDPLHPGYPHLVKSTDGVSSASSFLQVMAIHSDGTFSTRQLDSASSSQSGSIAGLGVHFLATALGGATPDGNGGTLLAVNNADLSSQSVPSAFYHDTGSAVTKLNLSFNPISEILTGEDGTAYLAGPNPSPSTTGALAAINTASNTINWTDTLSNVVSPNLIAVPAAGGVVFEDQAGHLNVTDPNGVISPLFPGSNGTDAGPVNTTNANYWTLGTWVTSLSDGGFAALAALPNYNNSTMYSVSQGNDQKQHAEPKGVKFDPDTSAAGTLSAHCTGLDDTKNLDPRWLMVPLGNQNAAGSNTVALKVKRGWQNLRLQSADETIATITPTAPTGDTTTITVTGHKIGVANITAIDSNNPSSTKATLTVSVKPPLQWTVSLFGATEQNSGIAPTNLPDPANLLQYLNSTYGRQANISFQVNPAPSPNLQIHYDLDTNGRLNYVGRSSQGPEADAITNYMFAIPRVPAANEKWMFYVHEINPTNTQGFAGPGAGFLEDQATNGQVQKTAHELGHTLGIGYNSKNKLDLMYEFADGSQPCRIPRSQWKLINPTPNDNASTP